MALQFGILLLRTVFCRFLQSRWLLIETHIVDNGRELGKGRRPMFTQRGGAALHHLILFCIAPYSSQEKIVNVSA